MPTGIYNHKNHPGCFKKGQPSTMGMLGKKHTIEWKIEQAKKMRAKPNLPKGIIPWNKGKKTGLIPWNKGKKGIFIGYWKDKKRPEISGSKNNKWKGGISKLKPYKHYKNLEYKIWRRNVFERDDYTCQNCGVKSGNGFAVVIHPHHIKGYTDYPAQRYEVDNGITLCVPCHHQLHWGH